MSSLTLKKTYGRLVSSSVLLSGFLFLNACAVSQCGVLRLQKTGKPGVAVSSNPCVGAGLALESIVYLQANANVRLVSATDKPGVLGQQIICQNQSSFPLKIRVSRDVSPWIQPEANLIQCNNWLDSRLECSELWSGKTALICAIAEPEQAMVPSLEPGGPSFRKSQITMRGPAEKSQIKMRDSGVEETDSDTTGAMEMVVQNVVNLSKRDIKPKIDQCRKNFHSKQTIRLSWKIIKSMGIGVVTAKPENISEEEFIECAVDALEEYPFPRFPKDIPVTYEF